MSAPLVFVGGDEVVAPFLVEDSEGDILDLTNLTVSGFIAWRRRERIALSTASEIDIRASNPTRAVDPDDQVPHGFIHLVEELTAAVPYGMISSIGLVVVDDNDVTMSTYGIRLERLNRAPDDMPAVVGSMLVFRLVHSLPDGFGGTAPAYVPSLDFSDGRNSQYLPSVMG